MNSAGVPLKRATYFPIHLDIAGRRCVVVGGGRVAERKVRDLLAAKAEVRVVSPAFTRGLAELARRGRIRTRKSGYERRCLAGAWLVIAATDDAAVNSRVARDAKRRRALVNVVDVPAESSFIVPAVVRRGPLSIGISTDGASPVLARFLKERCSACVGREYGALACLLRGVRARVKALAKSGRARTSFYERLIRSPLLALLKEGKRAEAARLVEALLERTFERGHGRGTST